MTFTYGNGDVIDVISHLTTGPPFETTSLPDIRTKSLGACQSSMNVLPAYALSMPSYC